MREAHFTTISSPHFTNEEPEEVRGEVTCHSHSWKTAQPRGKPGVGRARHPTYVLLYHTHPALFQAGEKLGLGHTGHLPRSHSRRGLALTGLAPEPGAQGRQPLHPRSVPEQARRPLPPQAHACFPGRGSSPSCTPYPGGGAGEGPALPRKDT